MLVIAVALLLVRTSTVVRAQDSEPYESWIVRGTDGRVAMRWRLEAGKYVLRVDTLGSASTPTDPSWTNVHHIQLPTPKRGYRISTPLGSTETLLAIGSVS